MAEYRIVAKIDPQTADGSNKVKQDLRGIQQEASATETALNRSFDQAKFDRTIGSLVKRLEQLDATLGKMSTANAAASRSNDANAQSLERMNQSASKAAASTDQAGKAASSAAASSARLDAALLRVLRATDQAAAEQMQMNALLLDAQRLYEAGVIDAERYAEVQRQLTVRGQEVVASSGAQRSALQNLGFQLNDVATQYALGASATQIFASQGGQIIQVLSQMAQNSSAAGQSAAASGDDIGEMGDKVLEAADKAQGMSGRIGQVAAFLSGPWGIALSVAVIALAPFVSKLFESNDALGDAINKLREDAKETELAARAKEAFARTIEGLTVAIREQNKELKESIQTQRDQFMEGMKQARQRLAQVEAEREAARRAIKDAEDAYEAQKRRASSAGAGSEIAALGLSDSYGKIEEAKKRYAELGKVVDEAKEAVRRADAALASNAAERAIDPIKRLNDEYDTQKQKLIEASVASKDFSATVLAREIVALELRRKKAIEAAEAQERLTTSVAKGVAAFKSREQAVGIAGRELQRDGFRVSENAQFGGVKGNHPGMGNAAHGKYAIDVNMGTGIIEADVPDIRAKMDAAAKRYAARGYKVLWNGNVYWPDGRVTAIQGANKHRDHIHLEAPQTIVGKPTQASTEQQYQREESTAEREANQAARLEERASDFIGAVVSRAASRGLPNNRQAQLQSDIDEAFADFERRFNRAASEAEQWQIRTALTQADAREIAQEFDEAYIQPLNRLIALQGKTGIEREILNAQIAETMRLGRQLEPDEEATIERGIRQGDQLERQARILADIRQPLEEYRATIEALNALFDSGQISLTSYNARMAEMAAGAASLLGDLPGVDPGTGMAYSDISATADENARYAKQLEDLANHRETLLQMGISYDALEEAAYQEHMNRLAAIDAARQDVQLAAAEGIAGSLTSVMESTLGKQSAFYKAAFATEKAVAIARSIVAIQTGIAQASSLPFPANLAAMAAVAANTASIISNISSVVLAFKDGGRVPMVGGPRSDSVRADLSAGEFVVNARDTARNLPLLEAINSGRQVRQANAAQIVQAGAAAAPAAPMVVPPAEVNVRNINVLDPSMVGEYLGTPEGETLITNIIRRNPEIIRQTGSER